jgi:integrase
MGRGAYGKGSVYESPRGSGKWIAQVRLPSGQLRRARCPSRPAAERQRAQWLKDLERRLDLRAASQSVRDYCRQWLADKEAEETLAASSLEVYARHLGYATSYVGHHTMEGFEAAHWRDARPKLLKGGLARSSVNYIHSILSAVMERAVKDRVIAVNPMKLIDRLPLGKTAFKARVLTLEEITTLEEACAGERHGPLLLFILAHGLRHKEALDLTWKNIHLDEAYFQVTDSKTTSGVRRVALTPFWVEMLREHRLTLADEREIAERRTRERAKVWAEQHPGEPIRVRPGWVDHDLVFPSERGTPQDKANVTVAKQRIFQKAGFCDPCLACKETGKVDGKRCEPCLGRGVLLWPIRIHDLRHTAITDWVAEGGPKAAQGLAGHATSKTTMDIYAQSRPELERETLERVEKKRRREG